MNRVLRAMLGIGCLMGGVRASGSLTAAANRSGAVTPGLGLAMGICATLTFGCFDLFRILFRSEAHRLVLGTVGSYLLPPATLRVVSWMWVELGKTQRWLAISILIGIPYPAPLVLLSGLTNSLIWPRGRDACGSD